jgi:hypothetical protein
LSLPWLRRGREAPPCWHSTYQSPSSAHNKG